jgi:LacI family transcriptional regulator, galactose operon repressor
MSRARDAKRTSRPPAKLVDVATAAGVDISTVSRILNNDPRIVVRDETRRRVLAAADELDYRPNAAALALKTARTMALGLVVPDLSNVAYAVIAEGARARADEAGYVLPSAWRACTAGSTAYFSRQLASIYRSRTSSARRCPPS